MDTEALDRLLMDRALGALPPDVDALLAAYLERDADAARRAQDFAGAALAARQVMGTCCPATLPPFPAARLEKLERTRRSLVLVRNVAGIAAALILGVALGAGLSRQMAAPLTVAEPPAAPSFVSHVAAREPRSSRDGFWSVRRLVDRARSAKRAAAVRPVWDSPIVWPRIGGES